MVTNVNIQNADEFQWTPSETSRCFAAIVSLWALAEYADAKAEEDEGLDRLEGYLIRQKEIADCLTDLWYENTCAMQRKAIQKANKVREPKLSCFTALTYWMERADVELANSNQDSFRFRQRYCIPSLEGPCDNALQIQSVASALNAATMDVEQTKRRAEVVRRLRWESINGVVRNMSINTGPLFGYLQNATALQTGLVNQAGSMSQGALTAFGSLLGYGVQSG